MDEQEWQLKREKLRATWQVQILQTIAIRAYSMAYEALELLQVPPESREEFQPEDFARDAYDRLHVDLEYLKNETYQSFFSDPDVPDDKRALLAEEFAEFVEKMQTLVTPPEKLKE
jgi:hypothetical protein